MICDITKQRIPLSQLAFFHLAVIRWSTGRARLVCFDSVPDAEVTNNKIRELYADPAKRDELIERQMEYVKLSVPKVISGSHQTEDLEAAGYLAAYDSLTDAMLADDPLAYLYRGIRNACYDCQGEDYYQINRTKKNGKRPITGCYTSYVEDRKERRCGGGRKRRERDNDGGDNRWDYYSLHAVPKNSPEPELNSAEECDKILAIAAGEYDSTASDKIVEQNKKILRRLSLDTELTWKEIRTEFGLPQQTISNRKKDFERGWKRRAIKCPNAGKLGRRSLNK